jgi:hypothetical protein
MEKNMTKQKSNDTDSGVRNKRIPVMVSAHERSEIERLAGSMGVGISTYLRIKGLESRRDG